MELFFYIILFTFGSLFWSFASVIIYRLKTKEKWILFWRSHCPKCKKVLGFFELIPILSWIKNLWKCKNCKNEISIIYIILELTMAIVFLAIWRFLINVDLINNLDINEIIKLIFWLFIWFITIVYSFYDILFLEIHEWIMFVAIFVTSIFVLLQNFWIVSIFDTLVINQSWYILGNYIGTWFLLFGILALYLIMIKWLKEIYDVLIMLSLIFILIFLKLFLFQDYLIIDFTAINSFLGWLIIFSFFLIQILISKWEWLWWGDLRIGLLVGLILWFNYILIWIFLTYLIGSFISIFIVILQKISKQDISKKIPFWPFIALGFLSTIFFQEYLKII